MRYLARAAVAVAALGALSSGANAAVYNTLNPGPNGLETFTFGDNDLGVAPTFTRSFTFNTTQAGTFNVLFGEVGFNPINNVEFTSATLNGTPVNLFSFLFPPGQFVPGGAGEPDIGFLVGLGVGSGDQTLTITGTNGGNGVFSGTASFSPTPVPGPIAGAGLPALFGLAGAALWRRRRQQAV